MIIKQESVEKMFCLIKSNQKSNSNEKERTQIAIMAYFVGTVELLF